MPPSPADVNAPVPIEYVLEEDADVHVANVELGVTFYLADPTHWGQQGAAEMLERFIQLAPQENLLWYTTSRLDHHKRVSRRTLGEVMDAFSVHWLGKLRHGFEFVLSDDRGSECTGFRYVEVDPRRVSRSALLELTLPAHFEPELLAQLADICLQRGPVFAGIGGYALRYNPQHRNAAFSAGHGWAKRYLGLDIQDRDQMPWLAPQGIPGVSWLNYLGAPLLERLELDVDALVNHRFSGPITVRNTSRALRIQAGDAPALGDLNRFQEPKLYEELARYLAPHLVQTPPPLHGRFAREQDGAAWFRRLLQPESWV